MEVYDLTTENGVQYANYPEFEKRGLKAFRKRVEYNGRKPLNDGLHSKELFRDPIIAASVVPIDESVPITQGPDWIEYIGDKR